MRLFFVVFVSALALSAADSQSEKKPAPKAPPKTALAPKPLSIPPDAVPVTVGEYRYTDPQGKKWIYYKTPFGISRIEDTGERAIEKSAAERAEGIKATEDGDTVRFERPGPFGVWKWEKKKADLDELEQAALDNSRAINKPVSKQD